MEGAKGNDFEENKQCFRKVLKLVMMDEQARDQILKDANGQMLYVVEEELGGVF